MLHAPVRPTVIGLLVVAVSAGPASAQIGLNFATGQGNVTYSLASSTSAGVVPQTNWNNVTGNSGTIASGSVVTASGAATTVTGSFTSTNSYSIFTSNQGNGNLQLLNGYLDNTATANPTTVTVSGIPYGQYNVYAYVGSDVVGRSGHVTLGSSTFYYLTNDNDGALNLAFQGYTQGTSTTLGGAASANYVLFTNVSGSSFTLTNTRDSGNVGLHGVQIIPVPEPAGVLAAAAAGVVALRRRRRRSA